MNSKNKIILECLKSHSISTPDKLALIDQNKELTYKEYWNKICSVSSYLKSIGVKKQEYVIIKTAQTVEYMVLIHATQLIGAVPVPIEKSVNEGRILELLKETGSQHIFSDVKVAGYDIYDMQKAFDSNMDIEEFEMPHPDDESMVLFTTGTTGKSKGIVIEYKAEFAVAENVMYGVEMKENNVEIIPMPMNHSFSLRRYFANMINGSTVILVDGVFFAKILFNMVEKYKATAIALAPAAMNIILKLTRDKIKEYENQFDYIQFGAAHLSEALKEQLLGLLPSVRMYNIYGSTEMGCACVLNFNSKDNMPQCIGRPTKNSIFRIINENGEEIKDATFETPGFLSYTGGMKMKCYFNDKELTDKTIIDNHLRSSDLGYIDSEGRVYMLGRADDVILSGGNKISPIEIEEIANKFPGVYECICKGKKDALLGEIPVLYIVADDGFDIGALEKHLLHLLEDFKRPRGIKHIETVPKTYNNKVDRKAPVIEKEI